ncbi:minor capsid protein [Acinetobacter haemolyticus]|uniref:minor capsid protein n=1 Tax=Acinetobacter haemolyticus TaxID=29430 RepID=UPI001331F6D1|nr:minor capsid protein [Acinetobacter haemolyticus]QHI16235.1 phage head morphogenesis protein [Acinetobacter haemolyticus]QHI17080.1 phage head morphogenesis protein [Acinetobacter haemolyticus]
MDKSAQKALIDALSQHQAYLYRASSQSVNELTAQFNKLSNVQLLRLSELLEDLTDSERKALQSVNFSSRAKASRNIEEIKATLSEWFSSLNTELPAIFEQSAIALAVYEASYTVALMGETLQVDGEKLYQKAKKMPFSGGQLVDYLFSDIAANLRKKVEYVIRDGFSQGQTNQQIINRIKGRKSLDYKDGLLQSERYVIERQVRTARSHVSNTSYLQTYEALGFTHIKFVSVLDGRSSFTCANLDQTMWKIDDPKIRRPPLHPNCRSTLIGVDADGNLGGVRPFVADERKIKNIPKDERDGIIGQVEVNTKFSDWFKDQDDDFQRNWLGSTRFELYKKSDFPIDKFVDPIGRKYTLDELKVLDAKTFKELGL